MPWTWSKAVSEGNVPAPQQTSFGPDQPTLADVYRRYEESFDRLLIMKSRFDQQEKKLNKCMEEMRCERPNSVQ